jgi:hypothetical protein
MTTAHAWVSLATGIWHWLRIPSLRFAVILFAVTLASVPFFGRFGEYGARFQRPEPLAIGLRPADKNVVQVIKKETTPDMRILWEDQPAKRGGVRWPALLPLLTERSFVGGLDPEGRIEHSHAGFVRHTLRGRPLSQWTDAALAEYCKRYNIGWVVAWSTPTAKRLREWTAGAAEVRTLSADGTGSLFAIKSPARSFALHGQAELVHADNTRITLANVVPKDGKVVVSFHYQTGMRASPSRVQVEREPDALDVIPLLRLRVSSPVSRVTLTWDGR